ncbi:MAG: FN3 associated domain-containing protein, partial [Bacteroidota bacterium]
NEREIELLHLWIAEGADTEQRLEEVEVGDTLYALVRPLLEKEGVARSTYAFDFADKTLIEELNTPFRTVSMLSLNSPALHAEIFVRKAYKKAFLEELLAIKDQLTSLNISNLPIEDADLVTIARFSNLEKLLLNNTDITGKNLEELNACSRLKHLALSGTAVQEKHLQVLTNFPALKEVYLWNTDIEQAKLDSLNQQFPSMTFESGYLVDETEILQLSPPRLKNKSSLLDKNELVTLESKFPNVIVRYTINGDQPDSLESPIYEKPFKLESPTTIKAKAYVEGWKSSNTAFFTLFSKGYTPDSVKLLTDANERYQGKGAETLTNFVKGKPDNFRSPAWLGYRDQPLEAMFDFGENPPEIGEIVGSFAQNLGSEIFPPEKVEIWGGNDQKSLKFLSAAQPNLPTDYEGNRIVSASVSIPSSKFQHYKVIVHPLHQTPKWHSLYKKGRKSWTFVDEIFFY